jgi:hypothetical protein
MTTQFTKAIINLFVLSTKTCFSFQLFSLFLILLEQYFILYVPPTCNPLSNPVSRYYASRTSKHMQRQNSPLILVCLSQFGFTLILFDTFECDTLWCLTCLLQCFCFMFLNLHLISHLRYFNVLALIFPIFDFTYNICSCICRSSCTL